VGENRLEQLIADPGIAVRRREQSERVVRIEQEDADLIVERAVVMQQHTPVSAPLVKPVGHAGPRIAIMKRLMSAAVVLAAPAGPVCV